MITKADIDRLIRPDLAALEPYVPIHPFEVVSRRLRREPEDIVKLDANENPYGPAPKARAALATYRWYHIYPDPQCAELRQALADYLGLPAELILAGHGADDLIDLLVRLFLGPGDLMIDCPPTFGMYRFDAGVNGARVIEVPRRPDFSLDLDGIAGAAMESTKLVFLCSPNNPDGGLLPEQDLRGLLALPLMVVIDEAYVEFAGPQAGYAQWVEAYPNLAVLRSFSKWAGLGGLRVGYGVFPPAIIQHLWKIKQPYNVNVAGQQAALASLSDRAYLMGNVTKLVIERERLYGSLASLPFLEPIAGSRSNFLLCRVLGREARQLKLDLEDYGILVRYFDKPGLENCIRVSAGRPEDTDALIEALRALSR